MSDADGNSLRQTEYHGWSPDGVTELTTLPDVFAQPPWHRYCPVTVPAVRPVHVGQAVRSGRPLGWSLARDVVTDESATDALTHARELSTDLPLT